MNSHLCPRCARPLHASHCQPCSDRNQLDRQAAPAKQSETPVTDTAKRLIAGMADEWVPRYIAEELERDRNQGIAHRNDVRAAIEPVLDWYQSDEHPARPTHQIIADIVADLQSDRSQALKLTGQLKQAHEEIERLETELAKASHLQQTVTIARQTIANLTAAKERLEHQLAEARDQVRNADLRTTRAKRERDAANQTLDKRKADCSTAVALLCRSREYLAHPHPIDAAASEALLQDIRTFLRAPDPSHQEATGPTAAPEQAMRCIECKRPMTKDDKAPEHLDRWTCTCGQTATRHSRPDEL